MVEIAGDILLCCLDPASGKEVWRQHLIALESGGIDTDAIRRVSGAMPTYHEGLLICPTGAGGDRGDGPGRSNPAMGSDLPTKPK